MTFSVKTGPMVGEHVENCRSNNPFAAAVAAERLGAICVSASSVSKLKVGEALRFDTAKNTGVSVERLASK